MIADIKHILIVIIVVIIGSITYKAALDAYNAVGKIDFA